MVFSSVSFLFFFLPAFLLCYTLLPFRNATLLAFSMLGMIAATPAARFLVTRVVTDRSTSVRRRTKTGGMVRTATDLTFAVTLISICAIYVASGTYNPFIYFRF